LKTKISGWLKTGWRILTEVPGWPDAPPWVRMRGAMPVVLPCMLMVLLLDWNIIYHGPRVQDQNSVLGPLQAAEDESSSLRLVCADQTMSQVARNAEQAAAQLIATPDELPALLRTMKQMASDQGWEATFTAADPGTTTSAQGAMVGYLPVRAKMTPRPDNADRFTSFNAFMDRFSGTGKRIDLIRLAVRADERRWHLVELNFRVGYPLVHAKIP
jgi:hypothetical protein